MPRKTFVLSGVLIGLITFYGFSKIEFKPSAAEISLIAHAGGTYKGISMSNSLEALEKSYQAGFRYFEVDFSWTSSGELVCIHDWDHSFHRLFPGVKSIPANSGEFVTLEMIDGLTPLGLDELAQWVKSRHNAWLITDIKSKNIEGLTEIRRVFGSSSRRVIPQIYEQNEIDAVRNLGFDRIIYTLYRSMPEKFEAIKFAFFNDLEAITIPEGRMGENSLSKYLRLLGIPVFTHTVNDTSRASTLLRLGAVGFYTDSLTPEDLPFIENSIE